MAGRSGRRVLEEKRWQSLEEEGSAGTRLEHPTLARSKTCDPPFCEEPEPAVAAVGRQGHPSPLLSKHAAGYRKAFGELAEREALLACFSCAWQKEVPYHGRLYISSHHICFHASLLLKDIKVVVPIASVSTLKKANTALLVPNALSIRTASGEKFLFVLLRQREATYQVLKSVCKHLQDKSWNSLSNKEVLRKSRVRPGNAGQEGFSGGRCSPSPLGCDGGGCGPATWKGFKWRHGVEKPQPRAAQTPGPSGFLLGTGMSPIGSHPCPHGCGVSALGTCTTTRSCPLSDLKPVGPGAEHPGARQPPGSTRWADPDAKASEGGG
ncbi:uncharacterized protein LOC130149195 isoform X1 [Falco biarmicus]|uniref:uncharacterized protein LOC130149195 isoform X1 n=1 Tax=Falco biarmicus TaxID=345155 RepID=UPI0024BC715D|nr:uncharacterized protein LOC130149195 isoform X1 [Falco biarmicus]